MDLGALLNQLWCYVFLAVGVLVIMFNKRTTRHAAKSAQRWSEATYGKFDLKLGPIMAIVVGVLWIVYAISCLRQH